MRERRLIVDLYQQGDAAVLVTVIAIKGSSYRSAGARLLIAADGRYAGAISGGCLEAEILRKARWVVRSGAVVERYSTFFDETTNIPYGLGCGGALDVLLEPAGTAECEALMRAMEISLRGETMRVKTMLPKEGRPLRRTVWSSSGDAVFGGGGAEEDTGAVFEEVLAPPQRLIVFGAGDDARPVARFAEQLGWSVWVVDGRAQWARAERFPEAEKVLVATSLERVDVRSRDAVVLMTHSYEQDRAWLTALLPRELSYIGMLGARHRSALLLSEAAEALGWPLERCCESVFAPVGLDLGGEGAEAIALAIVAEVQAHGAGKLPVSRRMTAERVRSQMPAGDVARALQTECAL